MANGEMALASAISELTSENFSTQVMIGENLFSDADNYMYLLSAETDVLNKDQEECSAYTEAAVTNSTDAVKAAEWRAQYQIDSVKMNEETGSQNSLLNKEEIMEHQQSTSLMPAFYMLEEEALLFFTNSTLISKF